MTTKPPLALSFWALLPPGNIQAALTALRREMLLRFGAASPRALPPAVLLPAPPEKGRREGDSLLRLDLRFIRAGQALFFPLLPDSAAQLPPAVAAEAPTPGMPAPAGPPETLGSPPLPPPLAGVFMGSLGEPALARAWEAGLCRSPGGVLTWKPSAATAFELRAQAGEGWWRETLILERRPKAGRGLIGTESPGQG
ncbi:MAG: hypothetical protein LBQ61_00330 [Spirochaetales bacterium]|jgi:hypothetical protein|nr:hypothetical protein [Spirochaetales bacterium]